MVGGLCGLHEINVQFQRFFPQRHALQFMKTMDNSETGQQTKPSVSKRQNRDRGIFALAAEGWRHGKDGFSSGIACDIATCFGSILAVDRTQ